MPAYPSEYELDVVLRDGTGERVRPIRPDDADQAKRFFEKLGPESRYFRFFRIKDTLEPEEIEYFTTVDDVDRMALVALIDGDVIGVGRYDREVPGGDTADVAFALACWRDLPGVTSTSAV